MTQPNKPALAEAKRLERLAEHSFQAVRAWLKENAPDAVALALDGVTVLRIAASSYRRGDEAKGKEGADTAETLLRFVVPAIGGTWPPTTPPPQQDTQP